MLDQIIGNYNTETELINYVINVREYGNVVILIACVMALIFGCFSFTRKSDALFPKIMLLGITCELFRAWFVNASIWSANVSPEGYNTSTLSHAGVFIFLSMQAVTLSKSKPTKKGKLISLLLVILSFVPFVCFLLFDKNGYTIEQDIIMLVLGIIAAHCINVTSRYIFDSQNDEEIKKYKKTNILILVYVFSFIAENYLQLFFNYEEAAIFSHILLILTYLIEAVTIASLPLVTKKEVK